MLRKLLYGVLTLLGLVVVIVGAALGLAQTPFAKAKIAGLIEGQLTKPGQEAQVAGLTGFLPFDIHLGRFALRDGKGQWLEVDDARIAVSLADLVRGHITVDEIGASRVALDHLPPSAPKPPSNQPFQLPQLPELPKSLPVVAVNRLHVDRLELGKSVLGQKAVFNLEGHAGTGATGERVEAALDLKRIDEPTATLAMNVALDLPSSRLSIDTHGQETGGLLAAITGRPQAGALHLSLKGAGPLDDWQGRLLVDAEHLAHLETKLDLAYASTHRVQVDGTFTAAPGALPPAIASVVGQRVDLALHAGETAPGMIALDRLTVAAGGLHLDGTGKADLHAQTVTGHVGLQVPDLAVLSGLAKTKLQGRAGLDVAADGALGAPHLTVAANGEAIRAASVALDQAGLSFDVKTVKGENGAIAGADVTGGGKTKGLAVDGRPVGQGGAVRLDLAATIPPKGRIELSTLKIVTSFAEAGATASVDRTSLEGKAHLHADVADVTRLAGLLPPAQATSLPQAGAVRLDGDATFGEQAKAIHYDLGLLAAEHPINDQGQEPHLARLTLNGDIDRSTLNGKAHLAADVPDLGRVAAVLPPAQGAALPRQGAVALDGTATTGEGAKRIGLDLTLAALPQAQAEPRVGDATTPHLARIAVNGDIDRTTLIGSADLKGDVPDLAAIASLLPPDKAASLPRAGAAVLDGKLRSAAEGKRLTADITLAALAQATHGPVDLKPDTPHVALIGVTANLDRTTLAGTVDLKGDVPQLEAVSALLPPAQAASLPLKGAVQLSGEARLAEQARHIDAQLHLDGDGLAGLPKGAAELLGPAPTLEASATIADKKTVTASSLKLDGAAISLSGDPRLAADGALDGGLTLRLPELARLEPAAGAPVAGEAVLKVALGGTIQAPDVHVEGDAQRLRYAAQSFQKVTIRAHAAGPVKDLGGDVRLAAVRAGQEMALAADYKVTPERVDLAKITLDGPSTRLRGKLALDLTTKLATGRLEGGVGDLSALNAWTQQQLKGSVDLDLVADAGKGRQDASARVTARNVAGSFGTLASADVNADVTNALAKPAVDASVKIASFAQPAVSINSATLTAKGPLDRMAVTLDGAGQEGGKKLALQTSAAIAATGEPRSVLLQRLTGEVAGQRLALASPAKLVLGKDAVALDGLDLSIGAATLRASLDYGGSRVAGRVRLGNLQLAMLQAFGAPALGGTVNASLDLAGTPARPRARLGTQLAGFALGGPVQGGATADLDLNASLGGGRLSADGAIKGLGDTPLALQARLPVRFALQPFAFAVPSNAGLTGRIAGPVDLARVAAMAALDGQRLAGVMAVDLGVAGTVSQPALDGSVRLADGAVDDATSGVALRQLDLVLVASGQTVRIERLSAHDRYNGTLGGSGQVALAGGKPSFDINLTTDHLRVLDSDLGKAELSSASSVKGDPGAMLVRSRLKVDRADLNIPAGGGGPSIPTLDVTRKGAPEPAPTTPGAASNIKLDVAVDMPGQIFVRGHGLDSEWQGNLQVKGQANNPLVTGKIEERRGTLNILQRDFTIDKGVVDFDGSRPPIPMIDIEASTETADLTATISVTGPATKPKITFSSKPPVPQSEVISQILFDRSTAQITPVEGIELAAAVRSLQSGGGGFDAIGKLRNATGLDTIGLQSGATPQASTATVGKYVSKDVYLSVQKGVAQGSGKAKVQVDITPNLSVGTSVDENSQTGVNLQWKYDY